MKNLFWSISLIASMCIGVYQVALSQCDATFRFVNNTGREVTDLHITFEEEGAQLVKHDFPGRPSTASASTEGPATNGTEKRWDIIKGRLPNKGVATLKFKSEDCRLRIASWYWTVDDNDADTPFGDIRDGTDAAGNSQDRDLVADGEVVTKLPLEQPYTKERNGKKNRIGINDLHIVTRKRPTVLNRTRKNANDRAKAGGIFETESVTTCDCNVPQRDKPCKQVCKGQEGKGTFYVLNLATASVLGLDDKVDLELKGVEPSDIAWHWWTKDGRPYTGTWNDPDRGGKDEGVPKSSGDKTEGVPKEDWKTVASISHLPRNSGSGSYLTVGGTAGLNNSPFKPDHSFAQVQMDRLIQSLYENPERFVQLFETFDGEVFIGSFSEAPRFRDITTEPQTNYGLTLSYGLSTRFAVEAGLNRFSSSASAAFPVMVINEFNGETQSITGQYELDLDGYQADLGVNYFLGEGPFQALTGAYFGLRNTDQSIQASIADISWKVDATQDTQLGYGFQIGGRYLSNSGFFLDLRVRTADFGDATQYVGQAMIGIRF